MTLLFSTQPLTIARDRKGAHVYLYGGAEPAGIEKAALDPDDAKRLMDLGFLKEAKATAPAKATNGTEDEKPAKVEDVLADVGDDKAKAAAALDQEKARGESARSTLVSKLEAIVNAED